MMNATPSMPTCAICGTTQQLLRCAKCKAVYYCSTTHQHQDWQTHKRDCRLLARQKSNNKMQQLQMAVAAASINNASTAMPSSGVAAAMSCNNVETQGNNMMNWNHQAYTNSFEPAFNNFSNTAASVESGILADAAEPAVIGADLPQISVIMGANEYGAFQDPTVDTTSVVRSISSSVGATEYQNGFASQTFANAGGVLPQPMLPNADELQQTQLQYNYNHNQYPPMPSQCRPYSQHIQFPHLHHQQTNNQIEKSKSYEIGHGDENAIGSANERRYEELCPNIINDMNQYGLSVVDDFLGVEMGLKILSEVHLMHKAGVFEDGQLVNNRKAEQDLRTIRGDKIAWVTGVEPGCKNVQYLINQIDAVVLRANTMNNNGKLGNYIIKERTKAMVACYPGSGAHYVRHVDNPNKDGRVITAIYYLNVDWDTTRSGGVLRIFPETGNRMIADIEPKFDRLIFFWSDKRNPHEVQPAHRTRYAITVWYFDANEREVALNRCKFRNNVNSATTTTTTATTNDAANTASTAALQQTPAANIANRIATATTTTTNAAANLQSNANTNSNEICT